MRGFGLVELHERLRESVRTIRRHVSASGIQRRSLLVDWSPKATGTNSARTTNFESCIQFLVLTAGLILGGCNTIAKDPGEHFESSAVVTAGQLKEAADGERLFMYIASDEKYHYFRDDEGYYKLSLSVPIPSSMVRKMEELIARGEVPGQRGTPVQFDGEKVVYLKHDRK